MAEDSSMVHGKRGWFGFMRTRLTLAFISVSILGTSLIGGYGLYHYHLDPHRYIDFWVFVCVLALSLLLATWAGRSIARRITAPLETLRQGARGIADGDFQRRLKVTGSVEVMDLADDFNHMAAQLEGLYGSMLSEYRSLFENASDSIFIHDMSGHFVAMNQIAARCLGYDRDEALKLTLHNIVAPEAIEGLEANLEVVTRSGFHLFETTYQRKDGARMPVEVSATLLEYRGQKVAQCHVRDIGERKQAEAEFMRQNAELSAQNAVSAIISLSTDLPTLLGSTLSKAIEALKADSGAIYLLDADGVTLHLGAHVGLSDSLVQGVPKLTVQNSYSGLAITQGKPVVARLSDYPTHWQAAPLIAQEDLLTLVSVPLLSKGVALGTLLIATKKERIFPGNEIELLSAIARQIGVAVENSRLYQQIVRQKQYAETVLHSIADGVYSVDRNIVVLSWSKGAEAITGYTSQEAIGRSCSKFLYHTDADGHLLCGSERCPFQQVWATGKPAGPEHVFVRDRSNRNIPVAVMASPMLDESGTIIGAVEVFRDVSIEHELMESIQSTNRAKSEFLANMSHELHTPLNAIIGFSQILQEGVFGKLNEKQLDCIEDILGSGKHLLTLVNSILDLSRLEEGKMPLELSPINLRGFLEKTLDVFAQKAKENRVSFDLRVSPNLKEANITADERKLKQTLRNLLSNALKFTPEGGAVCLEAQTVDSHTFAPGWKQKGQAPKQEIAANEPPFEGSRQFIQICVEDTGIGIAPEDLTRIFGEFYQVRSGTVGKTPGPGLGLSLARRYVEMHGGWIWAESDGLEKGSRFCFVLPIETAHPLS